MVSLSNHEGARTYFFRLLQNPWFDRLTMRVLEGDAAPMEVTVYIVRCSDGSYYTGLTKQEVEARVWEHNEGVYDGYTKKRRPVTLVFTETYDRIVDAIARERQIKGWSRVKKEALIALAYESLPELARNRQGAAAKPRG